jgi:hypothetical protein
LVTIGVSTTFVPSGSFIVVAEKSAVTPHAVTVHVNFVAWLLDATHLTFTASLLFTIPEGLYAHPLMLICQLFETEIGVTELIPVI